MYVEFPGGTRHPDGYIAPCEIVKRIPGWAKIRLAPAPPNEKYAWSQWVRESQILTDEEVEMA